MNAVRPSEKAKCLKEMRSLYTKVESLHKRIGEQQRPDVCDELHVAVRQLGFAISVYEGEGEE